MALADLLHTLQEEADAELAALEREARVEAASILATAQAEAKRLHARMAEAGEAQAGAEAQERRAAARLEAASRLRFAREQAYAMLRDELRSELAGIRVAGAYAAILAALIDEALDALPAATLLRIDARDADVAAELLARRSGAVPPIETALDTWGGVEVATQDGRRVENTLEARLAARDPELRRAVASAIAA